jgi:hypothetical protein
LCAVPGTSADETLSPGSRTASSVTSLFATGPIISLEKSWHGLHFVLTGSSAGGDPPLNFLLQGGKPWNHADDSEESPARLLDSSQVAAIHTALTNLSDEDFARRFDLEALGREHVYPDIWDEPLDDLLQEYLHYFHVMKEYIARAASQQKALIVLLG